MAAAPYNPGKPSPARLIGPDRFAVDSFRGKEANYEVDLQAGTCTCPAFTRPRIGQLWLTPCKHLLAVRAQAKWLKCVEKARQCSDADLLKLGQKYLGDEVISGAIIYVQHERRKQAKADRDLKEMFS
jgi:hypothetical protein